MYLLYLYVHCPQSAQRQEINPQHNWVQILLKQIFLHCKFMISSYLLFDLLFVSFATKMSQSVVKDDRSNVLRKKLIFKQVLFE